MTAPAKVALVTGAARGIGAATAVALMDAGWAVVAFDRAADDRRLPYGLGTQAQLNAVIDGAANAVSVIGDAADLAALAQAVAVAEERFGGLDAVIHTAGVIAGGVPAWEVPLAQEQAVMDVNLGGALAAARVGIPALLRRPEPRRGRFLVVASAAATRGLPHLAAYCAAKAGVTGLVRGLAADLRSSGITANAVSPGSTDTPLLEESARLYGLAGAEIFAVQQPIERLLAPEEVAAALLWLAGPDGAAVTGATLPVDGGLAL